MSVSTDHLACISNKDKSPIKNSTGIKRNRKNILSYFNHGPYTNITPGKALSEQVLASRTADLEKELAS